MEVPKPPCNT
jgi:hypothetical protein